MRAHIKCHVSRQTDSSECEARIFLGECLSRKEFFSVPRIRKCKV